MNTALLPNLDRGPGQNAAAIPGLEILPCNQVEQWPGTAAGVLLGKIKANPFCDWAKLYFTDQTKEYSEKASTTVHGRKYAIQVSGFFPGDTEELRRFLNITEDVRFIARIRDSHGVIRIAGTKRFGLELEYDTALAAEMSGRRGTIITFSAELPEPSSLEY